MSDMKYVWLWRAGFHDRQLYNTNTHEWVDGAKTEYPVDDLAWVESIRARERERALRRAEEG